MAEMGKANPKTLTLLFPNGQINDITFSYKDVLFSNLKWPWWQHQYSTSSKFLWRKKGRIKTRHVAGSNNFKRENRIILNTNFFSFAFENPNHCSKKVENFIRSNNFLTWCFYFSLYSTWKSLGVPCFLK